MKKQLLVINSPALGDTLCATPTLRKLYNTFEQKISVVTHHSEIFLKNKYVNNIYNFDEYKEYDGFNLQKFNGYDIHSTFNSIGNKTNKIEKKHNIYDIRQYHATDLGFMLANDELICDYIPDKEIKIDLPKYYICLHATRTWPSRTWARENWINLIENNKDIHFVLIGKDTSEHGFFDIDKKVFDFSEYGNCTNLLNKTTLSQIWHVTNNSKCIVTMDSGMLHIAGTTDTFILQLGSSINYKLRAPYRKDNNGAVSQNYKFKYIGGTCNIACASDMKYGLKEWGSIQSVPPLINCLENKKTFECHPTVEQVSDEIRQHSVRDWSMLRTIKEPHNEPSIDKQLIKDAVRDVFNKKKKLLYIAPHLSTGGMPKYLERTIELIKDKYDLYLIEYSFYSPDFVVQRNSILDMIDKDKFWSFEMDWSDYSSKIKSEVNDIINEINPDIIHMQEIPELFMQYISADYIYNKNRTWTIIETTHTTTFDLDNKKYFPDKFAHVGNYIALEYKNKFTNIPYEIIEYEPGEKDVIVAGIDLDKEYKHVLNIGIFTPNKRQDYIFELAKYLEKYKIKFHFIGNQANNFKDYWEPLMENKYENCIVYGELDNVDDWYASCDLFLFPSKLENNPIVLKEAIGWNMPILYKNLEVYDSKHDIKNYDNAIELTENIKTDSKLILKLLGIK